MVSVVCVVVSLLMMLSLMGGSFGVWFGSFCSVSVMKWVIEVLFLISSMCVVMGCFRMVW